MLKNILLFLTVLNVIRTQSYFGSKSYTEFEDGDFNVLISAPHDGPLLPEDIPERTEDSLGNLGTDRNTRAFAKQFALELTRLLNQKPFMVFNNLHRKKMDPNRNPVECCSDLTENLDCHKAHEEYHQFISGYKQKMSNSYKQLLIVDFHGQSHAENWTEIGYLLTKTELNQPILLDTRRSSIEALKVSSSKDLESLIRGEYSLGAFIERKNYRVIPSPTFKYPGTGNYYNGGYITLNHKSLNTNSIQIELAFGVRSTESVAKLNAVYFADAFIEFYRFHKFDLKV
ncbi:unnamed protein product [Brachionus calyciflorus]|uniref:N-formylglutamate amidohydrolase n=1 Tax=Brachionus calyciflorus TaxID=104777 RepID=A0A813TJJ4_9BILA|nr:unnamed protein product [Brachionus calyciflorus]